MKVMWIFDRVLEFLVFLAAFLLAFLMLSVCGGVVMRYFLHRPLFWVLDISEVILLYITFLGTAWVLKQEGHVKVEIVISRLKPRVQAIFGILSSIIGIVISGVLVWYGSQVTRDYFLRGILEPTVLELPVAPILAIIPLGSVLLFVQFLRRGHGYLGSWRAAKQTTQLVEGNNKPDL